MRRMLDEKDVKDISLETIEQKNLKPVSGTVENDKWKTITIGTETHGFAGGAGGDAVWGDITGDIADQTDLKNALDAKADSADLATVATTGDYDDLTDKPDLSIYAESADLGDCASLDEDELSIAASQVTGLANVATSGDYDDLTNKPSIPAAQVQSDWSQSDNAAVDFIKNKPALAAVATSGSYNDLLNKPTIPAAQVNADWNASSGVAEILNKPSLATVATSGSYNDLSDKPTIPTVPVQDVQINGTSILSSGNANIVTNSAYDATTNKITTMLDLAGRVAYYVEKDAVITDPNDNDYYHRMRLRYDTTDDEYKITLGKFYGGSGLGFPGPVTVVKEGKIKLETSPDSNTNYVEFYPTLLTTPNTIIHYDNIADKTNSET